MSASFETGRGGARKGQDQFEALVQQRQSPLIVFATFLTGGDFHAAEDLVQETLLKAWRNGKDATSPRLASWLHTVTLRGQIDEQRKRQSRPKETELVPGTEVSLSRSQEDTVLDGVMVKDALATLSEPQQAALREVYMEGRTIAEAAKRLGVPVGTVKSRLTYGAKALREALAERGFVRKNHRSNASRRSA